MDAVKEMKETFESMFAELKQAFIEHYNREPSEDEALALRKMVIVETAIILKAMAEKALESEKGGYDEATENHAHYEA